MKWTSLLWLSFPLLMSCQSSPKPEPKLQLKALDRSMRVDERVKAGQQDWLKGKVLDPDQLEMQNLLVFGDSYVDLGNLAAQAPLLAPAQVFWRSRWSDGPIFLDYVQPALNWKLASFAFAEKQSPKATEIPETSLRDQVRAVEAQLKALPKKDATLILLWLGPGQALSQKEKPKFDSDWSDYEQALLQLKSLGFKQFIIGNMPDLAKAPRLLMRGPEQKEPLAWQGAAEAWNSALTQRLDTWKKQYRELKISVFQSYEAIASLKEKTRLAGAPLLDQSCLLQGDGKFLEKAKVCAKEDRQLYWDDRHLRSRWQCLLAAQFLADLQDAEYIGGYNQAQAVDHCLQL